MQRDPQTRELALPRAKSLIDTLRTLLPNRRAAQSRATLVRHYAALQSLIQHSEDNRDDLQRFLVTAADACRDGLDADRVSIWLADKSGRVLELQSVSQLSETLTTNKTAIPLDETTEFLRAMGKGSVIASDDAHAAPHLKDLFVAQPGLSDTRSRIDVPIMLDGLVCGLIIISVARHAVRWSAQQICFAGEIGAFVMLAVERRERTKSETQLVQLNTRLLALAERRDHIDEVMKRQQSTLTSLINSSSDANRDVETELQFLVDRVRETLDVDRVALWLGSEDRSDCRVVAASDLGPALVKSNHAFPFPSAPIFLAALEAGAPLISNDVETAPHLVELLSAFPVMRQTKSRIDVPILRDGQLIGMMICVSVHARRIWSSEETLFCSAVSGVTAILLERHQRQRVETDLRRANAEVLAANEAKSLFLANMSHEIRTPMNGVFGMADLLLRTNLTERQTRLVSTINQSARTLLTIINDILDLSRIEAGKFELDQHDFDIHTTVEGAVELFVEDAQSKGLDLSLYIAPDVPRALLGDSGRLRQICVNLIGNAVKFTQAGEVAVRLTAEPLGLGQLPRLVLEVRDTGIGIPADVQARLFQPFAQADSSISRRFGGTGLGLSIAMHLANLMGGRVRLASPDGAGTTVHFEVSLPVSQDEPARALPPADLRDVRVLIVDDRETNREIVFNYLSTDGAQCETAANASDAMAALLRAHEEGRPFAAAVVDMIMPGTDGLALVQQVRADRRNSAMGIVMATSLSWKGDQRSVRSLGIQSLLTKPIRRADLTRAVAAALAETMRESEISNAPLLTATPTPLTGPTLRGHVLLAEDNPVNVEVAKEYLSALGLTYDVAADGAEACDSVRHKRYDLVLMDCQMPGVDGLEATRRIRAFETQHGLARLPIIAVTANAYDADRVACIEAGMDGYISKPFTETQLAAGLSSWLKAQPAGADPALDSEFVSSLLRERPNLYARISKAYLAHSPRLITELTEAAATGNVAALRSAAHSLKSSSANIGATRLADLCQQLEASTRGRAPNPEIGLVPKIAAEFRAVGQAITRDTAPRSAAG
jgi:two-component system, sensor histidine kinase and response regulator